MKTPQDLDQPCSCGSGKRYRRCCGASAGPSLADWEGVRRAADRLIDGARYCLHPDAPSGCGETIARAHTIQRSGGLSRIAHKGHVLQITLSESALAQGRGLFRGESVFRPTLVGIQKASTFTGFCAVHDAHLFAPVEKTPFVASAEQIFLLGYRALCHEVYRKRAERGSIPLMGDVMNASPHRPTDSRRSRERFDRRAAAIAFTGDQIEACKARHDAVLVSGDYGRTQFYALLIEETPDVLCSGTMIPEADFEGTPLQDITDLGPPTEHVQFSIVATDTGGAVLLSWVGGENAPSRLARTLDAQAPSRIADAAVRFAYESFSNVYASPLWWDRLPATTRQHLEERAASGMIGPRARRPLDALVDDGLRLVNWTVRQRVTNLW